MPDGGGDGGKASRAGEVDALTAAAKTGDRLKTLEALRDRLAAEIDKTRSARDVAALSRQLTDVLRELSGLASPAKGSPLDELAKRRAAREAGAPGQPGPDVADERG